MPATESTWRDTGRMHRIFAVSGVVLTISTLWMFWKDHNRSWKNYQVNINNIDLKMTKLREQQFETGEAVVLHQRAASALAAAKAQPLDPQFIEEFKQEAQRLTTTLKKWREKGYPYSAVALDVVTLDRRVKDLEAASQRAITARDAAQQAQRAAAGAASDAKFTPQQRDDLERSARQAEEDATKAEQAAGQIYDRIIADSRGFIAAGKIREDKALNVRKVQLGLIDAAKASVDIAIRDGLAAEEVARRQKIVDDLMGPDLAGQEESNAERSEKTFRAYNEIYQTISGSRKNLDRTLKRLTAAVDEAQKAFDDSQAELERLRLAAEEQEETYFTLKWEYPWVFGKKITTLPILDAFNSRRKIETLWAEGLMQDYNHAKVRRFDHCTTCHQSLTKTLPGQPTTPAYIRQEDIEMVLVPPLKDAPPKPRRDSKTGEPLPLSLEDRLGVRLATEGLLVHDDVTVALVLPGTPAAKALIAADQPLGERATGEELRTRFAEQTSQPGEGENLYPKLPGLLVGDVIAGINGETLFGGNRGPRRVAAMLIALAEEGEPIRITVRRGLPNPYISHPRLDLYLSDASPHGMQTFGCTVCHEGQGTATEFKWASHTPNTMPDMRQWGQDHGWFDNPHWIFPMYPKRFSESACLKCHHGVVELELSERFPDAPAPKVTHGYHLIRKYGCYGCHEVNGFDGPTRRIGPDLRTEPNYFAVAQQIQAELNAAQRRLTTAAPSGGAAEAPAASAEQLTAWKERLGPLTTTLTAHPEDAATRSQLRTRIEEGVVAGGEAAGPLERSLASLSNMLKDIEAPGDQRRPGPSLRFINDKVDQVFLYDWINNPRHFRDTTRMPRFFGLWNHLKGEGGKLADERAPRYEPIEIRGMIEYFKTYAADQRFEPEPRPEGISPWTDDEKVARGKIQFQTRGCLACHNHRDFPEVEKYRPKDEIVQGPDLSGVGSKFSQERNPAGPVWLYSWIRNPTKYHARTVMPNLFLDREMIPGPDPMNPGQDAKYFDPADDIVSYLLAASQSDWQPVPEATAVTQPLDEAGRQALKGLMLEHLNDAFYKDDADNYYLYGIPPHLEGELKGAEKDLVVRAGQKLTDEQRLKYIGRKTIAKYGCFGCHDIPGFEDAKPIGTGLADWGRKDPAKLAFEHIAHYAGHGHGGGDAHAGGENVPHAETTKTDAGVAASPAAAHPTEAKDTEARETEEFYAHALEATNRIGFIYQKLQEPRSYDFEKTENKRYNERLRMPQFPFSVEEREAVITFVLGLVADPPTPKYVFRAQPRNAALLAGRQVLEKYNCGGCHILGQEQWKIRYTPEEYGPRPEPAVYSFLKAHFGPQALAAAAKPDRRNELHATLSGLPPLSKADGKPLVFDPDGSELIPEEPYAPSELRFGFELLKPAIIDGSVYYTGQAPLIVPTQHLTARYPTWGGALTKYLLPEVTKLERRSNPNASGSEAYGWLPPPLIGEGKKVQTAWLHDFLLEPYTIRPATFLRMPKFNMSSAEATALANYFAAVDNVDFPYAYASSRDRSRLAALEADYAQRPAPPPAATTPAAPMTGEGSAAQPPAGQQPPAVSANAPPAPPDMQRLDDAMKIVVNGNFCVKCHIVADYDPGGSIRAKAPNLANVYQRLRPDYVRDWIANPKMILPYTAMPVNIPYENPPPILQQLYHGTNAEQIEALTDLLMNYDQYARQSTRIADRVVQPPPMTEGAAPAAPATSGAGSGNDN